jgi:hypothetical protein
VSGAKTSGGTPTALGNVRAEVTVPSSVSRCLAFNKGSQSGKIVGITTRCGVACRAPTLNYYRAAYIGTSQNRTGTTFWMNFKARLHQSLNLGLGQSAGYPHTLKLFIIQVMNKLKRRFSLVSVPWLFSPLVSQFNEGECWDVHL